MSNPTIPASYFVSVTPGVLSPGGTGVALNGLILTNSTRVPIGAVLAFASAADVATYFGSSSAEYAKALVYFSGFTNSQAKPGSLLFAQYNTGSVAAYLRGGNVGAQGLAALKALTPGVITVTIDGTAHTSTSIDLSTATSFSDAASKIATALSATPATVTYDSIAGAFVIESGTTGASSTITFATGTMSAELMLSSGSAGAVISQGAAAVASPAAGMAAVTAITTNFATFTTLFDPDTVGQNTVKQAFATWTSQQNNRYAYVAWDRDTTPATSNPATSSLGYLLKQADESGTIPIYEPVDYGYGAFVMGAIASIDFTKPRGRATMAFKGQAGLTPSVTDASSAANLKANGYNYYGITATGNQQWNFLYPGSISGAFSWIDSYVNQIWLNTSFQANLMNLLTQVRTVPYTPEGYQLFEASLKSTITQAIDNGVIAQGVTLSEGQAADVNAAAGGLNIAPTLQTRGWYLQVLDAPATVRAQRGSPPAIFWYTDGGSIQSINLSSVNIQ